MYRAEFKLETITPLFMRGADQSKAEFRPASVKGVMRWWFRALAGNYFGDDIEALKNAECRVFGCAGTGRSRVIVDVDAPEVNLERRPLPMVWNKKYGGRISANAIPEGSTFKVTLKSQNLKYLELASYSLLALLYLGGLGFRSNRGAGSLRLMDLEGDIESELGPSIPKTKDELRELPGKLRGGVEQVLSQLNVQSSKSSNRGCLPYSSLRDNCFGLYLWGERNSRDKVYYSDGNSNLLDEFEREFKNKTNHSSKFGYKDYVFGGAKPRRASPMRVGVVYLDGKYRLRISTFETSHYHPKIRTVYWSNLFKFLQNIQAERVYPNPKGVSQ
ncbi:type III-B CRISPR module RAMP protein Cmr1 [Thermococcus sp. 18S1]|uniref:type III-B CRISPR module RAMP protein Cmr1 n=1 Tax=Thermococcus sp. 18S1 TaxID=1638210 RepID=UPI00143B041D|nr:type III-B CRISPR module RAMP protein Cmr1 [Thermococcus sp. 18S1]NJE31234.1 type III-B CRISPR module RAMP protein Cmr1 [Thermococcus sp. 18S1]